MSSLSAALQGSADELLPVWIEIPPGFVPLPTENVEAQMAQAREVIDEVADEEQHARVVPMIGVLTGFLDELAARNVLYCGIGHHLSAQDGSVLTSSLTVALQQFPEQVNPRLLLKDLLKAKADADEHGQADLVDVDDRPMLFFEHHRDLPTPRFPGQPDVPDGDTTTVFQLEAVVPAEDGSAMVITEFSTPFTDYGPEFRAMTVSMAASVSFTEPSTEGDQPSGPAGSIRGRLG